MKNIHLNQFYRIYSYIYRSLFSHSFIFNWATANRLYFLYFYFIYLFLCVFRPKVRSILERLVTEQFSPFWRGSSCFTLIDSDFSPLGVRFGLYSAASETHSGEFSRFSVDKEKKRWVLKRNTD